MFDESGYTSATCLEITMSLISISVQVVPYGTYHLDLSPDLTIDELRNQLSTRYSAFADLSGQETLVFAAQASTGSQTLRELGLDSGSALFFVIPKPATTLELTLFNEKKPRVRIPASQTRALVGRNDEEFTEKLALDLEPLLRELGKEVHKVSRGQAWLNFRDSQWLIQPFEGAKAPVFVNEKQINQGETIALQDADVVAFGNKQGDPSIQFIVHYAID